MEVHHHPHVEKKNFKEYFLEFLMIFLAVTLGFFAENIRENISDRGTEHADLNSLVKNLTEDSLNIESALQSYQANEMEIDSLMELIKTGEYKNNQQVLYRMAYETRGSRVFPYSNTTFQQMESSGSLRLIRNDEIRYYIINYNNTINTDIRSLESRLLETEKKQAELQDNLLNDTLYPSTEDIIYKHALKTNFFKPGDHIPVFNQSQQAQFLKLYNLLFERNIINSYYKLELGKLKEKNEVLVAAIRKHYDL
ncbi:MAG TPA: hypothetical protein VLS85_10890 [Hanamia sp.]|nr:hypothetical protein [Hanamia sp.]